jgi:hypothetical protein
MHRNFHIAYNNCPLNLCFLIALLFDARLMFLALIETVFKGA